MTTLLIAGLLVLLQAPAQPATPPPPPPPPAAGEAAQPATPPPPAVVYDTGPMKAEVTAVREIRLKYMDSAERSAADSNFAMQVRISGEKLGKIKRYGSLILTEAVDDKGGAMVKEDTYPEQERTAMRPQMMPIERLREQGLVVATRVLMSTRGATKITKLKGSIKLVMADKTEKFTILNPYQYLGKTITDPRLTELGIELKIASIDDLEQPAQAQRCLAVQVVSKQENIQSIAFFDGGMQPIRHRENPGKTKDGAAVTVYCLDGGTFTNETSLVIDVHPQVEVTDLSLDVDNLDLP